MRHQQGMTLISWILVLGLIAFFSLLALRLVPMYQEYFGVVSIMKEMESELRHKPLSADEVRTQLQRRFNIGYIESVKKENIEILRGKKSAHVTKIVIDYEVREPLFAQLSIVGHFHKAIDIEPRK